MSGVRFRSKESKSTTKKILIQGMGRGLETVCEGECSESNLVNETLKESLRRSDSILISTRDKGN